MRQLLLTLCYCLASASFAATQADTRPPRTSQEWYLPTGDKGCALYVFEVGHGSPVIVVHGGFGGEHSYLLRSVTGLTGEHRFIFYDQRGSLRSPCPLDSISFKHHVDDLETLRKALGIEKLDIYSHSMGTMLTAEYMKEYPEHVGKVALTGALPMKSGKFLDKGYDLVNMDNAAKALTTRPEVVAERARVAAELPGPRKKTDLWRVDFAAVNVFNMDLWPEVQGGMAFYAADAGQTASQDMWKTIGNDYDFTDFILKHPENVTVISGDHDYADWQNRFFSRFHAEVKFRYVIIKNSAHEMWLDDPDQFRSALRQAFK